MTDHRKALIEAFEKFEAEQDKQLVTVREGGELRYEDGKFSVRGGVVKKMTYGIYRKFFLERA